MFLNSTFCYYQIMKKIFSIIFILLTFSAFALDFVNEANPEKNQAVVYVSAEDFGPAVEKIVIKTQKSFSQNKIDENFSDFKVNKVLFVKNSNVGVSHGEWSFTKVFTSDSKGDKIEEKSNFLTFLHEIKSKNQEKRSDDEDLDDILDAENEEFEEINPFAGSVASKGFRNLYGYKIENDELDIKITKVAAYVCPEITKFKTGQAEYIFENQDEQNQENSNDSNQNDGKKSKKEKKIEKITMNYVYYLPEKKSENSEKIPLILWFHGLNEGGTNPQNLLFGIKTTALAGEQIQSHFKNGAAILAPQAPTSWLEAEDTGAFGVHYWTPVDKDGTVNSAKKIIRKPFTKLENLIGNVIIKEDNSTQNEENESENQISEIESGKKAFAAVSLFSKPVKKLLDDFLDANPQIDRNRIYVGGCSAGGYMTMNMAIQYPDDFAAFFPICEYYLDSKISDAQINQLAKKPVWFTYAKNDKTVNPSKNTIPTAERLEEAGAKNLHVSVYDDVEWNGLKYKGHYSWIYVLNDDAKDGGLKLFDWLASR